MKKSDLKTGMFIECRNGNNYIVLRDCVIGKFTYSMAFVRDGGCLLDSDFNPDLKCFNSDFDVMKVYKPKYSLSIKFDCDACELIWKRPTYTYKDYVLEHLPDISTTIDGYPNIKPCILLDKFDTSDCAESCFNCWDKEYSK